jgi:RNA polymerase sigma-70 factor (ECF subfamily)
LSNHSDENLVVASRAGDNGAYAVLAKRYYKCVFVVCLGMLGSVQDAEDTAQETMLKGLLNIRDLRDSSQFGSWIIRIAKNHCINFVRRRKRANELITQKLAPPGQTPIPYQRLQQAIEKLPQETRLPLVMYYFGSESVKEVAEKLNLSRSAVYQRLKTATKELHKLLIKQGDVI